MSIEAMKQAVNMLIKLTSWLDQDAQPDVVDNADEVIDALCKAIEQAEKQEPVGFVHPEAIPRLKDSPSDWMVIYGRSQHPHNFPLYTAPPQREWVGLTNDEILEIDEALDSRCYSLFAYTRAIEAKLKEKNHAS
jgi:hypothetical protein